MLGNVKKRKRIDKFEYQSLRNVVKVGGNDVLEKFEVKFKEMIVKGHRKSVPSVMYTEDVHDKLPETYFTKSELEEIKIMYIGTESEAWKRYQRQGPFRRRSLDKRQRLNPRDSHNSDLQRQSRYDGVRSGDGREDKNRD